MGLTCGKGRKKSLECDIGNVVSGHSQELFIQNKILDFFFFFFKRRPLITDAKSYFQKEACVLWQVLKNFKNKTKIVCLQFVIVPGRVKKSFFLRELFAKFTVQFTTVELLLLTEKLLIVNSRFCSIFLVLQWACAISVIPITFQVLWVENNQSVWLAQADHKKDLKY